MAGVYVAGNVTDIPTKRRIVAVSEGAKTSV